MSARQTPALRRRDGNTVHTGALKLAAAGLRAAVCSPPSFLAFHTVTYSISPGTEVWRVGELPVTGWARVARDTQRGRGTADRLCSSPGPAGSGLPVFCENLTECQVVTLQLGDGAPWRRRGHWSLESTVHRCHDGPTPPAWIPAGASPSPSPRRHVFPGGGGGRSRARGPFSAQVACDSA